MSLPSYPKYKDSNVEWLGELPEHWDVIPLKHIASLKGRLGWQGLRADEYTEEGPFLVTSEHFFDGRIDWVRCYHVSQERYAMAPEIQLRPDDLLMMKDGAAMGKLAYVDSLPGPACLNSHLLLFRPFDGSFANRFLYYVLGCPSFATYMAQERTGTTFFGISQESIGAFPFALPPIPEQSLIVRVLDCETAKIDALVAEQRRLIELLQEKRQAVISHAVTKGLNSDAPMKCSGIEWLGDVPEHWKVLALKRIVVTPITDGPHETPRFVDDGIPFVSAEAISSGYVDFSRVRACISEEDNARYSLKYFPKLHDIYMVKSGATTGVTAIVENRTDFNIWSPLAVIRCGADAIPHFVLNFMRSRNFLDAVRLNWSFGTQQNIGMSVIENLACTLPPLDEQRAIIAFLMRETGKLDALIVEAGRTIELLQERRAALISAAVTGKIDMRGVAQAVSA